jgi:peroxiredoxin family protein
MKNLSSNIDSIETNNVLKIHFITTILFNILSRQKNVQIFVVFIKYLNIQLKKQENKKVIDLKLVVFTKYHDFLNVFSKQNIDVLSSHKKHDHRIKLKEKKHMNMFHFITCQKMSYY